MAIQSLLHLLKKMARPINRLLERLTESDDSDLDDLPHIVWAFENYNMTVKILNGVAMAIVALIAWALKPADATVFASLYMSISLLLAGLFLRRYTVKYSFSLLLAGVLVSIFQFLAYSFDELSLVLKVVTILCGIACFFLLGMPLWALFANRRAP